MEFDLTVLLNELGASAPFFLVLLWRVIALEKKLNNGITRKVDRIASKVETLEGVLKGDCPEEVRRAKKGTE
jgi:hypothetical protein